VSFSDQAQTILRQLPTLWATTGLQFRSLLTEPGVEPRNYSPWSDLLGFFKEHSAAQNHDPRDKAWRLVRMAHVTTRDDVKLNEGDQILNNPPTAYLLLQNNGLLLLEDGNKTLLENGSSLWNISGESEPHRKSIGFITWACIRSEMQSAGPNRGAGR
jgi:hypothetical protein